MLWCEILIRSLKITKLIAASGRETRPECSIVARFALYIVITIQHRF